MRGLPPDGVPRRRMSRALCHRLAARRSGMRMGRQDVRAEVPRTREGTRSGARARTRGRVGVASSPLLRRITSVALALGTLAALPAAAAAHVDGGCLVTGTSTSGGPIDLTTATVWHVR